MKTKEQAVRILNEKITEVKNSTSYFKANIPPERTEAQIQEYRITIARLVGRETALTEALALVLDIEMTD